MKYIKYALFLSFFLINLPGFSQKKERIEFLGANRLKGATVHNQKVNKLIGNVRFKHGETTMYCDSAYQYLNKNLIDAFGHVRIVKGDSIRLYGDRLKYNGDEKKAVVTGNVRLHEGKRRLTTEQLHYDMEVEYASYYTFGKIVDEGTTLTSYIGGFNLVSKMYSFKDTVILKNKDYTLETDTLNYFSGSKEAHFYGPTNITSATKKLYAEKGKYNTRIDAGNFSQNAYVQTKDERISGDSLYYDNVNDIGKAFGDVLIESFKDSLTIQGDYGYRDGSQGESQVYGKALLQKDLSGDTIYITGDTLIAKEDTSGEVKLILAYHHVQFLRSEMQGVCDSMRYELTDSVVRFFTDPVLWSSENQISADTIYATLKEGSLDKMFAINNAFLAQELEDNQYNQVKGREMEASFEGNNINKVDINGNGESAYFAYEEEKFIGLNKVICSDIKVRFDTANNVSSITFLNQPTAQFIPPQLIQGPDKNLKDFRWRGEERPDLQSILQVRVEEDSQGQQQSGESDKVSEEQTVSREKIRKMRRRGRKSKRKNR